MKDLSQLRRIQLAQAICREEIPLSQAFSRELLNVSGSEFDKPDRGIDGPDAQDLKVITEMSAVPAEQWFGISKWAKATNNLQAWQRGLAFSIGKALSKGNSISRKQAAQGKIILTEGKNLGFRQ